jgi:hypothetical protein
MRNLAQGLVGRDRLPAEHVVDSLVLLPMRPDVAGLHGEQTPPGDAESSGSLIERQPILLPLALEEPTEEYALGEDAEPMADEDIGARVVAALGEPAARELLDALERSDADRAALIGRLYARDDARWLAELLMDLEDERGELVRLRLIDALRREVGRPG